MPTSVSARAQTIRQAKKAYKASPAVPQLTESERKKLDRDCTLANRAQQAREKERRRQQSLKRKAAKEESERNTRKQIGIGLATQLAGYSHSQKAMKVGMEHFVRANRKDGLENSSAQGVTVKDRQAELANNAVFKDVQNLTKSEAVHHSSQQCSGRTTSFASESFGGGIDDDSLVAVAGLESPQISSRGTFENDNNPKDRPNDVSPARLDHSGQFEAVRENRQRLTQEHDYPKLLTQMPRRETEQENPSMLINDMLPKTISMKGASPVSDAWADFISSNTQIANEITPPKIISSRSLLNAKSEPHDKRGFRSETGPDRTIVSENPHSTDKMKSESYKETPDEPVAATQALFELPTIPASSARRAKDSMSSITKHSFPQPMVEHGQDHVTKSSVSSGAQKVNPVTNVNTSSFGIFGLSTQAIHCLVDDDDDLDDINGRMIKAPDRAPDEKAQDTDTQICIGYDSDSFGSDVDFGLVQDS